MHRVILHVPAPEAVRPPVGDRRSYPPILAAPAIPEIGDLSIGLCRRPFR